MPRHDTGLIQSRASHGSRTPYVCTDGDPEKALFGVGLQYSVLWGRGILEADLPWIRSLCHTLEIRSDPVAVVSFFLTEESYFAELWAGAIYYNDVRRVIEAVGVPAK